MTRDDDFIGQLEGYLDEYEGVTPLPGLVRDAIRAELPRTRQVGPISGPMRYLTIMRKPVQFVAVGAVLVLALIGGNMLLRDGGIGGPPPPVSASPSPSATPKPSALPMPAGVGPNDVLVVGRYQVSVDGVPFSFSVPTSGWEGFGSVSMNKSIERGQAAEGIIFWTGFPDDLYAHPCDTLVSPSIGPSIDDLADAVSKAPGIELVTGPADVTVGGRPAKYVALVVRDEVGCDPGFFYAWEDLDSGALWTTTDVGTTISVWMVEVDGVRLFIAGEVHTQTSTEVERSELVRDIQQVIDSIQFD